MYDLILSLMVLYIKNIIDIDVFDANKPFIDPDNYASIFLLNIDPISPHSNLVNTYKDEENNRKKFVFNQTKYINIRVDFRGNNASNNMDIFIASFLKERCNDILINSGFGFWGVGLIVPITILKETKAKHGMSTTIKLINTQAIEDDSQIIENFEVIVKNTL